MQIIVAAKNFDLTPSLELYAREKLGKIERYWANLVRVHVELVRNTHHKHGNVCAVSVWVEAPGNDLRAWTEASEMHAAIDLIAEKIERQVSKAKDRRRRD